MKFTRRTLLAGAAVVGSTAVAGSLIGCSTTTEQVGGPNVDLSKLPKYLPVANKPTPDRAGTDVIPDLYFSYPDQRPKSVNHDLGDGSVLDSLAATYAAPPTPLANNPYWKFINEKIKMDFQPVLVPGADYAARFATMAAGGALPTITPVSQSTLPARLDSLVANQFADLTSLLSGDGISKWPNLAAIPTKAWGQAMMNGKLWGVPVGYQPMTSALWVRLDLSQEKGIAELPKTKDEFVSWCAELTDAKAGRYALGGFQGDSPVWIPNTVWGMFKVPNKFRLNADGNLTKHQETDEYLEAIEFTKLLWDKGYFFPDSASTPNAKINDMFWAGQVIATENGLGNIWQQESFPDKTMAARVPYAADGGPGAHWSGTATAVSAISTKAKNPEMLLNVMDWLAAPFGTEEHFDQYYGPEGTVHTIVDGQPVRNKDSGPLRAIGINTISRANPVVFNPNAGLKPQYEKYWESLRDTADMLVQDPTVGFFAEANSKAGQLDKVLDDAQGDYILGRKNLDEFKQVIKQWRSSGGEEICTQFQAAIAKSK